MGALSPITPIQTCKGGHGLESLPAVRLVTAHNNAVAIVIRKTIACLF